MGQAILYLLHRPGIDEALRLLHHIASAMDSASGRLGSTLDRRQRNPTDCVRHVRVPVGHERVAVLYHRFVHKGPFEWAREITDRR